MTDVPITMKAEITWHLKAHDWTENTIPDPTLLSRQALKKER